MRTAARTSRRVVFAVFDGFELLDLSGPASVFSTVDELLGDSVYPTRLVSSAGGAVRCWSGFELVTEPIEDLEPEAGDTVLVVGGFDKAVRAACKDERLLRALARVAPAVARIGSVCSGTFVLGRAGLVDGRTVTTHWEACDHLARAFPAARVESDALYVNDGRLWTSAGVSSGIDMALAMVEEDLGAAMKGRVAKMLVVYAHRPGHQAQFSALLDAQLRAGERFADVAGWIETHLDRPIRVEDLARVARMSERTFARRFATAVGTTPARFVEAVRLERARALLEADRPVKAVAIEVGYRSEAAFRSAFEKRYGIAPSMHRTMHGTPAPASSDR